MKITDIQFRKTSFAFSEPFKVSFMVIDGYETLVVKVITDEGIIGYGEAAPLGFVTSDNFDTCLSVGNEFRDLLIGENPLSIERIHEIMDGQYAQNTAIKAAIDIACYDIAAKNANVPLWLYLGGSNNVVESDVTLGIDTPQAMAIKAKEWKDKGFNILKVKLGENPKLDLERMKEIRKEVGDDITLRIDANQGWNVKEAIYMANELEKLGIELVEQPVCDWNFKGLQQIHNACTMPIIADESCHSPMDALKLVDCVDGINIKLMKCGGIFNALKINAIAQAAGLPCMIGCMGESKIANAAGMHLAAAVANIQKVDLDVTFFSKGDEVQGGFTNVGGICTLSDAPGLGIVIEGF